MSALWQIRVYDNQRLVYSDELAGPLELGRQGNAREQPYTSQVEQGRQRLVIARFDEYTISRQHILLEAAAEGTVRLSNLSTRRSIRLEDGSELAPGAVREVPLPIVCTLAGKTVALETAADAAHLHSLSQATMPPGRLAAALAPFQTLAAPGGGPVELEAVIRWLQTCVGVLQSAANSADFFDKAARALVELVGLDSGRVLLLEQGQWQVAAQHLAGGGTSTPGWQPSRAVLRGLQAARRTFWEVPGQGPPSSASLLGVKAVVAAPLLDRQGEVIGALYGDRRRDSMSALGSPIGRLDAMLVELLAGGVAAGLARLEQERAALAARIRFEQAFTPTLSQYLESHPDLLEARDCEVTVLFADVRGFSRLSERLAPAVTLDWLRDVLGMLSDCVLDRDGVLVDYTGDEVLAMWGAPWEQTDHARRAAQAALDMVAGLPRLNARWQPILGEPVRLGIGINTGPARVGDTGSRRKFKYGPHGNTVNVGSRVQGATKYLQTDILLSGATRSQLDQTFATRRLCWAGVVNIAEPVELYELAPAATPTWLALKQRYETALEAFEGRDFAAAGEVLGALLADHPDDGPTLSLLTRVQQTLADHAAAAKVWQPPGK